MEIMLKPIGVVHSPFQEPGDIDPVRNVRPGGFDDVKGALEIYKSFQAGLRDIDGFSHLVVFFAFHKSQKAKLMVKPPFQTRRRGVFSTRSPHRPNPIGMTVVKVLGRKGGILKVSGVDMIEGTPILDIKPYTSKDIKRGVKKGWMEGPGYGTRSHAAISPARKFCSIRSSLGKRAG